MHGDGIAGVSRSFCMGEVAMLVRLAVLVTESSLLRNAQGGAPVESVEAVEQLFLSAYRYVAGPLHSLRSRLTTVCPMLNIVQFCPVIRMVVGGRTDKSCNDYLTHLLLAALACGSRWLPRP